MIDKNSSSFPSIEEGTLVLIDKPIEWTSFDVVKKIRGLVGRKFKIRKLKVGHAGTLDPLATGLMIVAIGKATKLINDYVGMGKEYIAEVKFGAITPTYDKESDETESFDVEHINEDAIKKTFPSFIGNIEQIPPLFSAKNVNGERAYMKARRGEDVELKPIQINIENIELLKFEHPVATIKIKCSKGTYIRSFANDLGKQLNSGAYLTGLQRTEVGEFAIDNALSLKEFEDLLEN